MSKFFVPAFLPALIFFAGCATPPSNSSNESAPTVWADTNSPATLGTLTYGEPIPAATSSSPAATKQFPLKSAPVTNVSNVQNVPKPPPVMTWTSLARWAAQNKISPPRLIRKSPSTLYAVSAGKNLMTFAIGSRSATWNGIGVNLGFEPEMIDGEIYLHGLDLEKNVRPLLCEPPLSFSQARRVIVLDPGHGGHNSGTISVLDGRPEKEFTLDLAKRLKPLLEAEGWTVFLTRTDDTDVAISNRVAFAESHHADCFISLHFNSAAPDKKQSGLETYCLTPTGMPSTITRGYADEWSENLPDNDFDSQNIRFAARVHKAVLNATGEEDRSVRRARFIGVLRTQNRPAILIEGGYLSNPAEAAKIENPDFRQKLAAAIANALK